MTDLDYLIEAARRTLLNQPPVIGDVPGVAAEAMRRARHLHGIVRSVGGGSTTAKARAAEQLATLAAVGIAVLGVDTPFSTGPIKRSWPATSVPCESCGAPRGKSCTLRDGSSTKPHRPRRRAASAL